MIRNKFPIQRRFPVLLAALILWSGPAAGAPPLPATPRSVELDRSLQVLGRSVRRCSGSIVDSIVVVGNTHTRRTTIVREMATVEGRVLDEEAVLRDYSYLRGLGYFSEVEIEVRETGPGRCNVVVGVTERPGLFMKYPYPILNYDLERGLSYGIRWRVKNYRGTGQGLVASFEKRRDREHGAGLGWRIPWLAGHRLRLDLSAFSYRRLDEPEQDDFIRSRNGVGLRFGLPLTKGIMRQTWITPDLALEMRSSRCSLNGAPTAADDLQRQVYLVTGLTVTYDSRDNLIAALRGAYTGASVRRFTSVDGPRQQYTFMSLAARGYIPLAGIGTIIMALDVDNRDGAVPNFYRLGIGGERDLRGFHGRDLRGTARTIGTIQWRRPVFGPRVWNLPWIGKFDLALNAVAFVDSGALMDSFEELSTDVFTTTGGFGIEVLSPFQDLVRFEAAFSEGGAPVFYVATGTRF